MATPTRAELQELLVKNEIALPDKIFDDIDAILNFQVKSDDTWIVTYPKSGTTWTQEMVWCIMNNLNFKKSAEQLLETRVPFLEVQTIFPPDLMEALRHREHNEDSIKFCAKLDSPRIIKSHLPWCLLPKQIQDGTVKPKIIYVTRNPKDVCASFYNHACIIKNFLGTLDEFSELFVTGQALYGSYFKHMEGFLEQKHLQNLLIISYEDMKANLPQKIKQVAKFLGKSLSDSEVNQLANHLSFDNMKKNPAVNYDQFLTALQSFQEYSEDNKKRTFINKGQVGNYKHLMSDRYIKKLDDMSREFEKKTNYQILY